MGLHTGDSGGSGGEGGETDGENDVETFRKRVVLVSFCLCTPAMPEQVAGVQSDTNCSRVTKFFIEPEAWLNWDVAAVEDFGQLSGA